MISDYIYIVCKVGDKRPNPGTWKENLGLFDGMIVNWVDPLNRGCKSYNVNSNSMASKAFAYLKVPKSWLTEVKSACQVLDPDNMDEQNLKGKGTWANYRLRSGYIDFAALEASVGIPSLVTDLRTKNKSVPVIDCTKLTTGIIKDASKFDFVKSSPVVDLNAVSSGSYTYGDTGSGDDYDNLCGCIADIANLTGALKFTLNTTNTDTAICEITENLAGNTLTFDATTQHLGNPNSALRINCGAGTDLYVNNRQEGAGTTEWKDLYFARTVNPAGAKNSFMQSSQITAGFTLNIHDMLMDGRGQTNGRGIGLNDNTPTYNVWNCKIWDAPYGFSANEVTGANTDIENLTLYNCTEGIDNNDQTQTYNSVAIFGSTNNFVNNANSTSNNCGTNAANVGAATDNNAQTSKTASTEFVSELDTSPEFMRCAAGGSLDTNGATIAIAANTVGIRGNARPHTGTTYSIGADEFEAVGSAGRWLHNYLNDDEE